MVVKLFSIAYMPNAQHGSGCGWCRGSSGAAEVHPAWRSITLEGHGKLSVGAGFSSDQSGHRSPFDCTLSRYLQAQFGIFMQYSTCLPRS